MLKSAGGRMAGNGRGMLVAMSEDDLLRRLNADRAARGRGPLSATEMKRALAELRSLGLVETAIDTGLDRRPVKTGGIKIGGV
jgi:hypothetical protein